MIIGGTVAGLDALRLAARGIPVPGIAKALGVTLAEAAEWLATDVAEASSWGLDTEAHTQVELAHLDALRHSLTPHALDGDLEAARLLVNIHRARAALLKLTTSPAESVEGVESELDQIRARRAARTAGGTGAPS